MADTDGMKPVPPSSPVYHEVARLYRIARQIRPGGLDRWNGELYARFDDKWGGLGHDGSLRLSQDLVLRHLTGDRPSDDPWKQAQALATVLHETYHARAGLDAAVNPNAVRRLESLGLYEGLTETATVRDFRALADAAGYDAVPDPDPQYRGAFDATNLLLDHLSTSDTDRADLLYAALDVPLVMCWDKMADRVVRNRLPAVPADAPHQQAARAHLVHQMALPEWTTIHDRRDAGPVVAAATLESLNRAEKRLERHYQENPDVPYPARNPNPAVDQLADFADEQARRVAWRSGPADLSSDVAEQTELPPELNVLTGQAPAYQAIRHAPVLGDGGRGSGRQEPAPTRGLTTRPGPGRD